MDYPITPPNSNPTTPVRRRPKTASEFLALFSPSKTPNAPSPPRTAHSNSSQRALSTSTSPETMTSAPVLHSGLPHPHSDTSAASELGNSVSARSTSSDSVALSHTVTGSDGSSTTLTTSEDQPLTRSPTPGADCIVVAFHPRHGPEAINHDANNDNEPRNGKRIAHVQNSPFHTSATTTAQEPKLPKLSLQSSEEVRSSPTGQECGKYPRDPAIARLPSSYKLTSCTSTGISLERQPRIKSRVPDLVRRRRSRFLATYEDIFHALLPTSNHLQDLVRGVKHEEESVAEYEELSTQPQGITATMKPYQITGLSFLVWLHRNGGNGILADEMGLGKTMQTLSFLQYLKENPAERMNSGNHPSLVVCPLSVLETWMTEVQRFAPGIKALRFHGSVKERTAAKRDLRGEGLLTYDLIVTSYDVYKAERKWFVDRKRWHYVILDEGQRIKNADTALSSALRRLRADYRLILTGTPVQNDLLELWAFFSWLYPEVFVPSTKELFKKGFDLSHGDYDSSFLDACSRLLKLIMLRRLKESAGVDLQLPPRKEVMLFVPLSTLQRLWYLRMITRAGDVTFDIFQNATFSPAALLSSRGKPHALGSPAHLAMHEQTEKLVEDVIVKEPAEGNTSTWRRLLNLVMQLRKVSCHPYLIDEAVPDPYVLGEHVVKNSGKFVVLDKLVDELVLRQNRKILIFSEFVGVLNCVEDLLQLKEDYGKTFRYLRIDGSTGRARRNLNVRMFQDQQSEYKVMLISTKAGGLGVTLTAAWDVVFMDEAWNPQVMLQAEARSHRIGQSQPVTVYKLLTQGTVEEQMLSRLRKKLYLSAKLAQSTKNNDGKEANSQMRSGDDEPCFTTSELKALIQRGSRILARSPIDLDEMLTWNFDTILQKCQDKASDHQALSADKFEVVQEGEEKRWLSEMERVKCAVFEGVTLHKQATKGDDHAVEEFARANRRVGKERTVLVDGFAVSKESLKCQDGEAVATSTGKDTRLMGLVRAKREDFKHQSHCHACKGQGQLLDCSGCPRSYHERCITDKGGSRNGQWYCPQHACIECQRRAPEVGGMLFRCRDCVRSFCEDHIDWVHTTLLGESLTEFEALDYPANARAFFVQCSHCKPSGDEAGSGSHSAVDERKQEASSTVQVAEKEDVKSTEDLDLASPASDAVTVSKAKDMELKELEVALTQSSTHLVTPAPALSRKRKHDDDSEIQSKHYLGEDGHVHRTQSQDEMQRIGQVG